LSLVWPLVARQSRYSERVDPTKAQVDALRRMLETELDQRLKGQRGCWPLVVGLLGVLLGLALLAEKL
jgi:hypothetical protein